MEICKHSYIRQDPYFFRCVKCGDTDPAEQDEVIEALHNKIDEQQARIQAAIEVYAGMEGFIPETAAEGYCLRIIEQMNEALQEQTP